MAPAGATLSQPRTLPTRCKLINVIKTLLSARAYCAPKRHIAILAKMRCVECVGTSLVVR